MRSLNNPRFEIKSCYFDDNENRTWIWVGYVI